MTDQEYMLVMRRLEELKTGQERMEVRLNRIETALGVLLRDMEPPTTEGDLKGGD